MELAKIRPVEGAARISTTLRYMYTAEKTISDKLDHKSCPCVTTACKKASLMPEKSVSQQSHHSRPRKQHKRRFVKPSIA